jgi:hypothetical protein
MSAARCLLLQAPWAGEIPISDSSSVPHWSETHTDQSLSRADPAPVPALVTCSRSGMHPGTETCLDRTSVQPERAVETQAAAYPGSVVRALFGHRGLCALPVPMESTGSVPCRSPLNHDYFRRTYAASAAPRHLHSARTRLTPSILESLERASKSRVWQQNRAFRGCRRQQRAVRCLQQPIHEDHRRVA